MNSESSGQISDGKSERQWRPLSSVQRRVIGVLVEKAKTTPDAYPMTLNGLTAGCNQKSNRSPQMALGPDDVETALEQLRELGAVVEVQAGGRVPKYRHLMYEWLAVDKVELAVVTELLLRGPQSIGALRSRASRMDPIADLDALRTVLDSLATKELVVPLSPPGRGQVFAHCLYRDRELAELRAQQAAGQLVETAEPAPRTASSGLADLQAQVAELRAEVARLRAIVEPE